MMPVGVIKATKGYTYDRRRKIRNNIILFADMLVVVGQPYVFWFPPMEPWQPSSPAVGPV